MLSKVKLSGLTCPSCQKLTEKRIGQIPDVTMVKVDLRSSEAEIESQRSVTAAEVQKALEGTNYYAYD